MTCPTAAATWRDYLRAVQRKAWAEARATLDVWHAHHENCPVCNPGKEREDDNLQKKNRR